MTGGFSVFWLCAGIYTTCMFWGAIALLFLCAGYKRKGFFLCTALAAALCYFLNQCVCVRSLPEMNSPLARAIAMQFTELPRGVILLILAAVTVLLILLYRNTIKYERTHITDESVREATDSLPAGICVYMESGRPLMVNRKMQDLCTALTGSPVMNGQLLRKKLSAGAFLPGCEFITDTDQRIIKLSDGSAWTVMEQELTYENRPACMLMLADITELYTQTVSLKAMRKQLSDLNERLVYLNQEIVSLTAERELLNARVRLHDEMGADLLTIRRYIENGGTEQDRADIEARLRRNAKFLLTGQASQARDEYELIFETAQKLGIKVITDGRLPQKDPQKHVAATAIHECFTNTLRHAHGDELRITTDELKDSWVITFKSNGEQPEGPIQEKGGLATLRKLAEQIPGGRMEISVSPCFAVILTLPKEVSNVI